MDGTQANKQGIGSMKKFENDVKMYGTQALFVVQKMFIVFENDVKMYGTQANMVVALLSAMFENDVKMYGTQA